MDLHALFQRLGFDVIRWPAGTSYHVELQRLLAATRPDLVADIGGNRGQFADHLRAAGYKGAIVSFEPVAATAAVLADRANRDPLWTIEPYALGDRQEERTINVPAADDSLASFLQPTEQGRVHFPQLIEPATETVEIRRLDSVLADRRSRLFLKVDTQGWDLRVLKGATGVLDRIVAVQIELALEPLYAGADEYITVLAWLRDAGFTPTAFFTVASDQKRTYEVDCLLRRTIAA